MTTKEWAARVPWSVVACAAGLTAIGLAGIARGDELSRAGTLFGQQAVWAALALPTMVLATLVPYRALRPFAVPLFVACLGLLTVVYVFPPRNGSRRWIPLGFMYFQPSEAAKLAYILALAHYLMFRDNYRRLTGLLAPFALTLVPMGLILKEPDLGTALVFLPVMFAMLFAAGVRPRHLALVGVLGVATLPALWMGMSAEQRSRVVSLFIQTDGGPAPRGDGYHLHQSKQVLALGGPWGSAIDGMPIDDPAAYHLPACRTDFVFCMIGERWGIAGAGLTLLLYAALFARGLSIAGATREPFGRLVAVGIVAMIATQVVINAGMTVGLMPVTGLTLPFVSYGGSSLLAMALALGLLLNVGMRPGYEMTPEPFRWTTT